MNITIINDCRDANAIGRQSIRASALIGGPVSFVGVQSDIEASGNLIDAIDAYGDTPGVIMVNVAPRNGKAKKWKNGTPFGYFWYQHILVVASIDGLTLSLVKKLDVAKEINVLDIPTVIKRFVSEKVVDSDVGKHIIDTQFRSYDFLPRVAAYILKHKEIESEKYPIESFADAASCIWWVDNFGNCKTTLLENEVSKEGNIVTTCGTLHYFERLKDVPDKTAALVTGSSGLTDRRFLEIVIQGESVAKVLKINSGHSIF